MVSAINCSTDVYFSFDYSRKLNGSLQTGSILDIYLQLEFPVQRFSGGRTHHQIRNQFVERKKEKISSTGK